jgi:hypothetical protein
MTNLPVSRDRMPVESRKPRAGPLLDPDEVIACALNYAMQFEFWKREINEKSQVVAAIEQALRVEGYEIVAAARIEEKVL